MPNELNIAAVARRTGVAPATLRKWEERYGVLHPRRTAGGQRRYGELDVARVEWLRARLAEGYRIREAAALLGSAELAPARTLEELREAIYAALERDDADALEQLLEHTFAVHPLATALGDVAVPLLARIGDSWAEGALSVAQEHLFSAAVRTHLERLLADSRGGVHGTAVLACAPGERHELGLLMLALSLRADGWNVAYLGADTPLGDALTFADRVGARMLCLSVALEVLAAELDPPPRRRASANGVELVVGGRAATTTLARRLGGRYVGSELTETVGALRRLA